MQSRQFSHDKSLKEYEKARIVTEITQTAGETKKEQSREERERGEKECGTSHLPFVYAKSFTKLALRTCQSISWSGNLIQAPT